AVQNGAEFADEGLKVFRWNSAIFYKRDRTACTSSAAEQADSLLAHFRNSRDVRTAGQSVAAAHRRRLPKPGEGSVYVSCNLCLIVTGKFDEVYALCSVVREERSHLIPDRIRLGEGEDTTVDGFHGGRAEACKQPRLRQTSLKIVVENVDLLRD